MPTYKFDLDILNKLLGTYVDIINLSGGGIGLAAGSKLVLDKPTGSVQDYYDSANSRRVMTMGGNDALYLDATSLDTLGRLLKNPKGIGNSDGRAILFADQYDTLQDAINALPADGGTIILPPGYAETITTTILPVSNCAIICPSHDAVLTDGSAGGIIMIHLNGRDYITISGIKFVGKGSGKSSTGINARSGGGYAWAQHCLIERCWFHDCKYGIRSDFGRSLAYSTIRDCFGDGYADAVFLVSYCPYVLVQRCAVNSGTANYGFSTGGYDTGPLTFRDCHAVDVAKHGFSVGSSVIKNILFDGCMAYQAGQYGFNIYHPVRTLTGIPVKLNNCVAQKCGRHGFYFSGNLNNHVHAVCVACNAIDNSTASANTYSGFKITQRSDRIQLIGCRGKKEVGTDQKYGFDIDSGSSKCEVRGGTWYPNQTGTWLDNGTDTIIDARDD